MHTCLALLCCVVYIPASADTIASNNYAFYNFTRQVQLIPDASGWYNLSEVRGVQLKITNRLIIKVAPGISKKKLRSAVGFESNITELYRMHNGIYYILGVPQNHSLQVDLERISHLPFVNLVQPDLLQKRPLSEWPIATQNMSSILKSMKVPVSWMNNQGKGVRIAIIDDGFDLSHVDLQGTHVVFEYDVDTHLQNASPKHQRDTHGTRVAGVIFARRNNIGVDGIAPEADFIAIRSTHTWTSDLLLSFYLAKINKVDIINCSWTSTILLEPIADVITDLVKTGRKGKGIAVVFAAGNQGVKLELGASEAALPEVISVGATDSEGHRLKFSNYGARVDLYALGFKVPTTMPGNKYGVFSGTSAAAPIVSGLIALKLAANASLTVHEIERDLSNRYGRLVK